MDRRDCHILLNLALVLAAVALVQMAFSGPSFGLPENATVFSLRAFRLVSALAVGAALAVGGVFLQSMLRNPLASPDLLGLASGAGLGVMLAVLFGGTSANVGSFWFSIQSGPALLGAFAALAIVYALSQRRGLVDPVTMILVGVVVSIVCGSLMMLAANLIAPTQLITAQRYLMGNIREDVGWPQLGAILALTGLGTISGAAMGPWLDAGSLSEDEARSVGVNVPKLRLIVFALAGILTAGAVLLAGPVGFVGLICPHLARLVLGAPHRPLVIGSALVGGALVVGADACTGLLQTLQPRFGRLPVGIITALIGGPVLVLLLRRELAGRL